MYIEKSIDSAQDKLFVYVIKTVIVFESDM